VPRFAPPFLADRPAGEALSKLLARCAARFCARRHRGRGVLSLMARLDRPSLLVLVNGIDQVFERLRYRHFGFCPTKFDFETCGH